METQTKTPPVQEEQTVTQEQAFTHRPFFHRHTTLYITTIVTTGLCVLLVAIFTIVFAIQAQKPTFSPHIPFTSYLTPTPTPIILPVKPIHEGNIGLLEGNTFFLLNTNTMVKTKLPLPKLNYPLSLTFSHDGNTLITGDTSTLVLYNLKTKHVLSLPNLSPNPRVDTTDDIAPNDKYFVLTQSCCPGDVGKDIMDVSGKILFQQVGSKTAWSPDSNSLAISRGEVPLTLPLGPQPSNQSVYIDTVSVSTVSAKLLIKATNQASYSPITWIDNHTLLYEKDLFSRPFPNILDPNNQQQVKYWMNIFDHPTITYHSIDIQTHVIKNTAYTLPKPGELLSADGKWNIVVDGKGSAFGPVYLITNGNKQKEKISDYGLAVWQPREE